MGVRQGKWSANSVIGTAFFFLPSLSFLIVVLQAGAGGGLVASIATCPLDVIKTKLQAQRAVQGQQAYLGVLGMTPHPYALYLSHLLWAYRQVHSSLFSKKTGSVVSIGDWDLR